VVEVDLAMGDATDGKSDELTPGRAHDVESSHVHLAIVPELVAAATASQLAVKNS
jgi:hypothetical protein